tara:strand:- start:5 stop:196 length:192 start_codon:yes stop_codon:yes gene_type:complete
MAKIISFLNKCGPLFFGVFFLAPVLTEIMNKFHLLLPYVSNLIIALIIGSIWGLVATLRGSWI